MGRQDLRTLVIVTVVGLLSLGLVVAFVYFLITEVMGSGMSRDNVIKAILFFVAIVIVLSIPKLYFFITKKPSEEPGSYSLDEVKEE